MSPAATTSGVYGIRSCAPMDTPASSSAATASVLPDIAAQVSGVRSWYVPACAAVSAPAANSTRTTSAWFSCAARSSAVRASSSRASAGTPASSSRTTAAASPSRAARGKSLERGAGGFSVDLVMP
nr:hypothetical protein [Streptomyces salinarius]